MSEQSIAFSGSGDCERVLRELFAALSPGRHVPTDATQTEDIAYDKINYEYRTAQGDGLIASVCKDYGGYHNMWSFTLDVEGKVVVNVFANWREPTCVFSLSATADLEGEATETLIRIATASGFTLVTQRDAT